MTLFGSGVTASPNRIHREVNNSAGRDALYKRDDDGLTTDYDQRPEMVYLSQPRYSRPVRGEGGVPISQLGGQYRYDPSSGAGSIVYMLDTVRLDLWLPQSMLNSLRVQILTIQYDNRVSSCIYGALTTF